MIGVAAGRCCTERFKLDGMTDQSFWTPLFRVERCSRLSSRSIPFGSNGPSSRWSTSPVAAVVIAETPEHPYDRGVFRPISLFRTGRDRDRRRDRAARSRPKRPLEAGPAANFRASMRAFCWTRRVQTHTDRHGVYFRSIPRGVISSTPLNEPSTPGFTLSLECEIRQPRSSSFHTPIKCL